jgi:hypothetical protein
MISAGSRQLPGIIAASMPIPYRHDGMVLF